MRLLIYTDNHFCERFSLVNKFGSKYSQRLENQIESINWLEELASNKNCQYIICAGDFFDKPQLTDQELTALRDIKWAESAVHYFLVGNHESEEGDLKYNSTKALEGKNRLVISEPKLFSFTEDGFELAFLPYITESQIQPITDYFPEMTVNSLPRILISHNNLKGIPMGPVISQIGFSPSDLEKVCTCCINGHLHNGTKVSDRVINLGNLTGKDFGENSYKFKHQVLILDTDTMSCEFIENPHAFNFYQIDINEEKDLNKLTKLKNNAIVSIQCVSGLVGNVRELLPKIDNIIESRVMIKHIVNTENTTDTLADLTVDQYAKFVECCKSKLENTKILEEELAEVLK